MKSTERSSVSGSLKPAVLCDFDDTTAVENVATLLLLKFGGDAGLRLRERYHRDGLTLKEYQEEAFSRLGVSRDTLQEAVREEATLRPYFKKLWQFCRTHDIPLAILTHGLDFYVEALLKREGLEDVPYYAVVTRFTSRGMDFIYRHVRECCQLWGNCKCAILDSYRSRGHFIVYVGDGRSDFRPASKADLVFARSHLAEYCQEKDIKYHPLQDFRGVLEALKEMVGPLSLQEKERGEGGGS